MKPNTIRWLLIALLAVAAVLSVVGNKLSSPLIGWVAFAFFSVAVYLYFRWRRALHNVRKANETRSGTDQ
jgi:cytochrome oxidase assembly protein ShyY1